MSKPRVLILGGGFAGTAAARELERFGNYVDVTLVNRQNFMLFTPMLPEVAGGSIAGRDIMQPLRAALRRRKGRAGSSTFELGEAVGANLARRTVTVRHPLTHESRAVEYDELVIAVGATDSTMGIPGVTKFAVPLKTIADAEIVRGRVIGALEVAARTDDLLERDRLLRFVIIGGNFTGVELAGELSAFLDSILEYYPRIDRKKVEVYVLEAGARLLGHLPEKFGRYAAETLTGRGTFLRLKQDVNAVDGRGVELKSGERIASATVLWAAGEKPSPLAELLGLKTNERGAIETGGDFAVEGAAHVWAVGDCAAVPGPTAARTHPSRRTRFEKARCWPGTSFRAPEEGRREDFAIGSSDKWPRWAAVKPLPNSPAAGCSPALQLGCYGVRIIWDVYRASPARHKSPSTGRSTWHFRLRPRGCRCSNGEEHVFQRSGAGTRDACNSAIRSQS